MPRFLLILICCLFPGIVLSADSLANLQLLVDRNDYASAVKTGERMLGQQPQQVGIMFLTAYAYQMNAQQDKAVELYERMIHENPDLPEPRNNLAMIYLARGDYDYASQLLVAAINTHPSYATAYQNLNLIYKSIASEAYRRAVSESSKPANYAQSIQLAAISSIESAPVEMEVGPGKSETTVITLANLETQLLEQIKNWASAWSNKDFTAYISFYSKQHRANFDTRRAWVEYRRKRVTRPGGIKVEIDGILVRYLGKSSAIVEFKQAFDSPGYSDRVVKRLEFTRSGSQWKITRERVLSVI